MIIELEKIEQVDLLEDGLLEAEAIIIEDGCEGKIEKFMIEGMLTYAPLAETPDRDVGFGRAEGIENRVIATIWLDSDYNLPTYEDIYRGSVGSEELLATGWKCVEIEQV